MSTAGPDRLLGALRLLRANWPALPDATSSIPQMMAIVPSLERVLAASADWPDDRAVAAEAAWLHHELGRYYLDIDLPAPEAAAHLLPALAGYRALANADEADRVEITLAHAEYKGSVVSDTVPDRYRRGLQRIEDLLEHLDPDSTTWAIAQARRSLYRSELGRTSDSAELIAELRQWPAVRALPARDRYLIDVRHVIQVRKDPTRLVEALGLAEQVHDGLARTVPDTRARADCLNMLSITARRVAPLRGRPGWEDAVRYRVAETDLTRARAAAAAATGSSLASTYRLQVSRSLNNAAVLYLQFGALAEAEDAAREAIQIVEEAVTPRIGTRGIRYGVAGWVALARFDLVEAIARFDVAIECAERIGSRKAGVRMAGSLFARVLAGDDTASLTAAREELAHLLEARRTSDRSRVHTALGLAGARLGDPDAMASFDRAYQILERTRTPGEYPTLRVRAAHAVALRLAGHDDEAEELVDDVAARLEASVGTRDHWLLAVAQARPPLPRS